MRVSLVPSSFPNRIKLQVMITILPATYVNPRRSRSPGRCTVRHIQTICGATTQYLSIDANGGRWQQMLRLRLMLVLVMIVAAVLTEGGQIAEAATLPANRCLTVGRTVDMAVHAVGWMGENTYQVLDGHLAADKVSLLQQFDHGVAASGAAAAAAAAVWRQRGTGRGARRVRVAHVTGGGFGQLGQIEFFLRDQRGGACISESQGGTHTKR